MIPKREHTHGEGHGVATTRALSEVAEARALAGDAKPRASGWDAWKAKHQAAAKIPWAQGRTAKHMLLGGKSDSEGKDILEHSKPEDRTLSPDGNKLHVITTDPKSGSKLQHEFTKTPAPKNPIAKAVLQPKDSWAHHAGGGLLSTGVKGQTASVVPALLKSGVTKTGN